MFERWRWIPLLGCALQLVGCDGYVDPPGGDAGPVAQQEAGALATDAGAGATPEVVDASVRSDAGAAGPVGPIDASNQAPVEADSGGGTLDASAPAQDAGTPPDSVDAGDGGTDSGGSHDAGPAATGACGASSMLKPGNSSASLMVGSVKRDYLLHVPASYNGSAPVPLVVDFHPLMMDAAYQRSNSGYAQLSDKEGFIVAYPAGVNPAWNVGPCCTRDRNVDDVGFAKALVAKLISQACIDEERVYAVGFSNGGGMAHHVACNAADVFAAVAPAAFDLLVENEQPCKPSRPIAVKSFRSTNDSIVPYAGGASNPPTLLLGYSLGTIHFRGAQGTFTHWSQLNQCTGTPTDAAGCKTYTQCAAGVEVSLCTSASGHSTGPAADGWAFLKRFTRP